MRVIHLTATAGPDGVLRLAVPAEVGDYDVKLELTAKPAANGTGHAPTPEERGWPAGYFESVVGSVSDDSFVLPERCSIKPILPLDGK